MVMCRVKDPGEGFSLDEIEHAAIANPDDDPLRHVTLRDAKGLRPGGYGVLLARKLVDELIYSEKGQRSAAGQISRNERAVTYPSACARSIA